ncbi:glycoside hydrolase family 2 TIM barrel-domain containing protein [Sunxiuqinia rutila]|uniref:glycoside hydrolase family 2 protein n=1 Tax=Sunxiuqinia rutila TaxID=1397841 RepID=UPI003D36E2B6
MFLLIAPLGYGQLAVVPRNSSVSPVKVDLNGRWNFNDSFSGNLAEVGNRAKRWPQIEVPGEWSMQGFQVEPGKAGVYSRSFEAPKAWKNCRIFLRCDAVFSQADIVINGKEAGSHVGPMVAFEKEISSLIKPGKENRVTMAVTAETMADTLMSGTQYAAHQLGGILRKIYLYAVPETYLADLVVETPLDNQYNHALLNVSANLKNAASVDQADITVRLFSPSGDQVQLADSRKTVQFDGAKEQAIQFSCSVNSPKKWDAEHPNLYRLEIELSSSAGVETIVRKIGFRHIEVVGNQLFVNGVAIKLKGVNRHEVHPLRGRSLTSELWKQDAELFKRGNVNYIRTSHYPPSEEFIALCDSLGLYVELENPVSWVGHHANEHWKTHDAKDSDMYPYFESIARADIAFFRNHPSILIWSMANESMWTDNWSRLADFYAEEDPTRPATFHDQAYGGFNNYGSKKMPIANIHYPGTGGPRVAEDFERPLLFGEYAHLNTYNREEIVTDPGVRDAWGRGFRKMWEGMYKSRGCLGGAIWSGIDDVFYLPDGRAVGYGEWGPIDGWRREKPEYYHMKKSYSPVKIHNQQVDVPEAGQPVRLQIENRFNFTNLSECKIYWEVGTEQGTVDMVLQPQKTGILNIYTGNSNLDGKILTVRIVSPQGIEVEACAIEIGNVKRDDFPFQKVQTTQISASESNEQLTIAGQGFEWLFDLSKGDLNGAWVDDNKVLAGGAELMMLELRTGSCNTEHSLEIPLHNSICTAREVNEVTWKQTQDTVLVSVQLSYAEAEGVINYSFTANGDVHVDYQMKSKVKMNPRQWGLVFSAPATSANLQWYRKGLWSWYPENHIGRTNGKAVPFGEKAFRVESFGQVPENDWRYDAILLGTNDFRATRENIYWAALSNAGGDGITVVADGKQAFRSFVDGADKISFLVAGYSTGGGDLFFSGHYNDERIPLEKGSILHSTVKLQLIKK